MATSFFYIYIDIHIDIDIDIYIHIYIDIYKLTERPVVLLNAIFVLWEDGKIKQVLIFWRFPTQAKQSNVVCFASSHRVVFMDKDFIHLYLLPGERKNLTKLKKMRKPRIVRFPKLPSISGNKWVVETDKRYPRKIKVYLFTISLKNLLDHGGRSISWLSNRQTDLLTGVVDRDANTLHETSF